MSGNQSDLWVDGALRNCSQCNASLCLRKQVINLALDNVDEMFCLRCLAEDSDRSPREVLTSVKGYIRQRDCFAKEWKRYETSLFCPDPDNCFPKDCFDA